MVLGGLDWWISGGEEELLREVENLTWCGVVSFFNGFGGADM